MIRWILRASRQVRQTCRHPPHGPDWPPVFYWLEFGGLAVALAATNPWFWPFGLWGRRLVGGAALAVLVALPAFQTWPPSCFALQYPVNRIFARRLEKSSLRQSRQREMRRMWRWEHVGLGIGITAALGIGRAGILRRALPSEPPEPPPILEIPDGLLVRMPGASAHWDPWRRRMVVGTAWTGARWLDAHVLSHEAAHAQQPVWRTRMADVWIKAVLVAGVALGGTGFGGNLMPWVAGSLIGAGDVLFRWPLERAADREATARLRQVAPDPPGFAAWAQALERSHAWAQGLETARWALLGAVGTALAAVLRHGR